MGKRYGEGCWHYNPDPRGDSVRLRPCERAVHMGRCLRRRRDRGIPAGRRNEASGSLRHCLRAFGRVNRTENLPRTLAALAAALRERRLSPVEVVGALLERIETVDKKLIAFITVLPERALEEAARVEKEILDGEYRGPLHGVPVGLKDLIYTKGVRTTMGSAFFEDHVPDHSATVVSKLEEAGAIIIGKTNTHEFAFGPTGDSSHFGPTRNPHDLTRIPGGSSGGSGAAVAAELCYAALGSDTAASIRVPAALAHRGRQCTSPKHPRGLRCRRPILLRQACRGLHPKPSA